MLLAKCEEYFAPFRDKRRALARDLSTVEDILREGAKKARVETQKTMDLVREAIGLKARPVI
jgi:tryptophanyl-tRNA synthetase